MQSLAQKPSRIAKSFTRPDCATDRLFQVKHEQTQPEAVCHCPTDWQVKRRPRDETCPLVHYGIIASGNSVVKNAAVREKLRQMTGALAFDMGAAGLMQTFPTLVIRGICDYSDSHKSDMWHGYAALAASAYAKELVLCVPQTRLSHESPAQDLVRMYDDRV